MRSSVSPVCSAKRPDGEAAMRTARRSDSNSDNRDPKRCGAEPEFAVVSGAAEQTLVCGRCHARWPADRGCPFCGNRDMDRVRTLATPDRVYRVIECLECGRYLKAMDPEAAGRPLMPFYDPVATLPLDAAMMQK